MTDIEQMFHSFAVREDHRDFLRFLWYNNNDPDGAVAEYRMTVHTFGNTSSPAIATFGLRKTAEVGEPEFGSDAKEFVDNDFYVDDGLKSMPNSQQAIDLLQCTQAMLATANLRLHKVSSNDPKVMNAIPPDDRAADLCDLNLNHVNPPVQRTLGVSWDLKADAFTFTVDIGDKKITQPSGQIEVSFVFGKAKLAPPHATTIPSYETFTRIELTKAQLSDARVYPLINSPAAASTLGDKLK